MRRTFIVTALLAILASLSALSACKDPAADKPKAQVSAATATAPAAQPIAARLLRIRPAESKVEFTGSKITRKHEGGFRAFEGTIELPDGKPETARIKVDVDLSSLFTDEEKLTGHLKSPDFFDVAKFPKATFTSSAIQATPQGPTTHTITGNLDLHGVTKSISFPATVTVTPDGRVTAKAEFSINRKDFGIVYPGLPDDLIRDDVLLRLDVQGVKG
jgi:polyisoprenoid-binding protein YceI